MTLLKSEEPNVAIKLVESKFEEELPERLQTLQSYKDNLAEMAKRQEEKSMALGFAMLGLSLKYAPTRSNNYLPIKYEKAAYHL